MLKRIFLKSVEHGREITLARVREKSHDGLACILRPAGYLGCCKGGRSRRDADQQAFLLCQLAAGEDGLVVLYLECFVYVFLAVSRRYEAGPDTLYLVRSALPAAQDGRGSRLDCNDLDSRIPLTVPPVPTPATKTSTLPSVSRHISGPVVR